VIAACSATDRHRTHATARLLDKVVTNTGAAHGTA
jgi:hypothetical protein